MHLLWPRSWRIVRSFAGLVLGVIGLSGVPDDLSNWQSWIESIPAEGFRWMFVLGGLALIITANWASLSKRVTPSEDTETAEKRPKQEPLYRIEFPIAAVEPERERAGFQIGIFNASEERATIHVRRARVLYGERLKRPQVSGNRIPLQRGEEARVGVYFRMSDDEIRADIERGEMKQIDVCDLHIDVRSSNADGRGVVDTRVHLENPIVTLKKQGDRWLAGRIASIGAERIDFIQEDN